MANYQPWYTGETAESWDIPLTKGGAADNITGVLISTFTMTFRSAGGVDTPGTGTFSVKTLYPAEVYYKASPADVASVFNGTIIVKAAFPPSNGAADQAVWDPIPFNITAS